MCSSDLAHKPFSRQRDQTRKETTEKNKCLCLRLNFAFSQPKQDQISSQSCSASASSPHPAGTAPSLFTFSPPFP